MGWLVVLAIGPLAAHLAPAGVWLLAAGGLAYTLGSVFYLLDRVPYTHAIWHVFVLGGATCHFLVIALFVV
jgi:hemolysin III